MNEHQLDTMQPKLNSSISRFLECEDTEIDLSQSSNRDVEELLELDLSAHQLFEMLVHGWFKIHMTPEWIHELVELTERKPHHDKELFVSQKWCEFYYLRCLVHLYYSEPNMESDLSPNYLAAYTYIHLMKEKKIGKAKTVLSEAKEQDGYDETEIRKALEEFGGRL